MLYIKFIHIIFIVFFMSGIFYLPRLFVYHSVSFDEISYNRFLLMEKNLILYIIFPSLFFSILSGFFLLYFYLLMYINFYWFYLKIFFVCLLVIFYFFCIYIFFLFKNFKNMYSNSFYRMFNEVPFFIFVAIVFLVVVKPF